MRKGPSTEIIVTGVIRVLDFMLELTRGMGHWKWGLSSLNLLFGLKYAVTKSYQAFPQSPSYRLFSFPGFFFLFL